MTNKKRKGIKQIFAVLLVLSLVICSNFYGEQVYAANQIGIVTTKTAGSTVTIRSQATTSSASLGSLVSGTRVTVLDSVSAADGYTWYHISYTNTSTGATTVGYMRGDFITVTSEGSTDSEFAQQLRAQGFPESYIAQLDALHNKYPNWVFQAVNTGLDWNTVIERESRNGINMVLKSADDSMKSTNPGAYDWNTNTWTIYDGSSWVGASSEYIAYYMDPRNFLDETNIFQFESLSYQSGQTVEGVNAIVANSFLANTVTDSDGSSLNYANAFVTIGQQTGVSPYHLASRVLQEQGRSGSSSLISGTYPGYEGYYNYFNFGASGSGTTTVITTGLTFARNQGWNTRYKALYGGAQRIAANYIARGQDTLYFQKFNVVYTASLYSHQYMGNLTAAYTEGRSMANAYTDKTQAFVFRIPVYNNMPESAVSFTATGNPNNYLKTLSISGLSLTPSFTGATTEYSVIVDGSVSTISVDATAVASTSTVTGTGNYTLAYGTNTITVNCKSKSGNTRTYTITVFRQDSNGLGTEYNITSSTYSIGTYVTGVAPGTNASTLLAGLTTTNCTVQILDAAGNPNGGTVGTGNKLAIYVDGNLRAIIYIVIYGDMNGDGSINSSDIVRLYRYQNGVITLSGPYLVAADTNRDGSNGTATDMVRLYRTLNGKATITQ